jgi:hypothetical protein
MRDDVRMEEGGGRGNSQERGGEWHEVSGHIDRRSNDLS